MNQVAIPPEFTNIKKILEWAKHLQGLLRDEDTWMDISRHQVDETQRRLADSNAAEKKAAARKSLEKFVAFFTEQVS